MKMSVGGGVPGHVSTPGAGAAHVCLGDGAAVETCPGPLVFGLSQQHSPDGPVLAPGRRGQTVLCVFVAAGLIWELLLGGAQRGSLCPFRQAAVPGLPAPTPGLPPLRAPFLPRKRLSHLALAGYDNERGYVCAGTWVTVSLPL